MYYGWTAYGGGGGSGWGNSNYVYGDYGNYAGGWDGNGGSIDEPITFILERYVGTAIVSRSKLISYPTQAQALFFEAIRQMAGQSPQGIKLIWYDYIYDQIESTQKSIENSAEAWNFHRDDWDLA